MQNTHCSRKGAYCTNPATQGWLRCCQDIPWQIPRDGTVCINTKKDKPMSQQRPRRTPFLCHSNTNGSPGTPEVLAAVPRRPPLPLPLPLSGSAAGPGPHSHTLCAPVTPQHPAQRGGGGLAALPARAGGPGCAWGCDRAPSRAQQCARDMERRALLPSGSQPGGGEVDSAHDHASAAISLGKALCARRGACSKVAKGVGSCAVVPVSLATWRL